MKLEMKQTKALKCVLFAALILMSSCSSHQNEIVVIKKYPVDVMQGILTTSDVGIDEKQSADGRGALKIVAEKTRTVKLYETGDIDVENARLLYSARIRTENVDGQVYLEMWCHFPGKGEYFSRALHAPISGTTGWTTQETPFFLKAGENPDNIKLNLVINGTGTAWIDEIKLVKGPLN